MKRFGILAATAVLSTSLLTGCSGGGDDEYCDALGDARDKFSALDSGDFDAIQEFSDASKELADKAPDEVSDEWKAIRGEFEDMEQALDSAGLTMADLQQITETGEMPEGVSQEDLSALGEELNGFGEDVEGADEKITEHAKDTCDIDLNESA